MKRFFSLIAAGVFLISGLAAETLPACMSNTTDCNHQALLLPLGIWPLCKALPSYWFCSSYQPGHEMYLLLITPGGRNVTNFRYTVTGTINDGTPYSASGTVDRSDDARTLVTLQTNGIFDAAPLVTITERVDLNQARQ